MALTQVASVRAGLVTVSFDVVTDSVRSVVVVNSSGKTVTVTVARVAGGVVTFTAGSGTTTSTLTTAKRFPYSVATADWRCTVVVTVP